MASTTAVHDRKTARKTADAQVIRIQLRDNMGRPRWITADLVDTTPTGFGISLVNALQPGATVLIRGRFSDRSGVEHRASVRWCAEVPNGSFRAGLEFLDNSESAEPDPGSPASVPPSEDVDYYEIMQLGSNADGETIDRVYRLLAQRYHPDNTRTGDSDIFIRLTEAYRTLSDPEQRAKYDAHHRRTKRIHWNIFDQARSASGQEAEQRKRSGILALLYAKTLHDPERGHMTIFEFEDLLACPREHLQAALWFLRGKGYIQRSDNGRHTITVLGFEEAEKNPSSAGLADMRQLKSGSKSSVVSHMPLA